MQRARKDERSTFRWVMETFGGTPPKSPKSKARAAAKADLRARAPEIADLRRIPEARDFRRENPGADIYDYQRYLKSKGK